MVSRIQSALLMHPGANGRPCYPAAIHLSKVFCQFAVRVAAGIPSPGMTPVRFYNDTQPENPSAGSFLPRLCLEGTRLFLQAVKACLGLCGNFKKWWNYR